MDSGCLADGESPEEQYDLERHLQPEELIWLLDELTCGEVRLCQVPHIVSVAELCRLPGLWVIHCHRRCSHQSTWTGYFGRIQGPWQTQHLIGESRCHQYKVQHRYYAHVACA